MVNSVNTSTAVSIDLLHDAAHSVAGTATDYDALLDMIGDARFVLIGEASHGTHEFYQQRAEITKALIVGKGFNAVAVEADWPDAYRVNRYVQETGGAKSALDSLEGFKRFPTWMWRNMVVLDFINWLHDHNCSLPRGVPRVGFYGLDLYSMYTSIGAVLEYLEKVDPEAAKRARYRYSCIGDFGEDPQAYGYAAAFNLDQSCETEVVNQLFELQRKAGEYARRDGRVAEDELFFAEQNARLIKDAEQYYRTMFTGRVSSWNLRDQHMAETLTALVNHLSRQGKPAKVVVWEHNSHIGDARATEVGQQGELNVGQLVRERYGNDARLIGFSTYTGTVTAASDWDRPAERKRVRPALPGSYEALLHEVGIPNYYLVLRNGGDFTDQLRQPRLERAIGVIYRPQTERLSHYFHARLPDQFDAIIHWDETRAVSPLELTAAWETGEPPETFPTGM